MHGTLSRGIELARRESHPHRRRRWLNELWFVDPTAGGNKTRIPLAPRPMDLAGKVVGLIDNTKEQADVILETIAHELRRRATACAK